MQSSELARVKGRASLSRALDLRYMKDRDQGLSISYRQRRTANCGMSPVAFRKWCYPRAKSVDRGKADIRFRRADRGVLTQTRPLPLTSKLSK